MRRTGSGKHGLRGLGATTAGLAKLRGQWKGMALAAGRLPTGEPESSPAPERLTPVAAFGSNPGNLEMLAYVPAQLAPSPALVVVLHGCTQNAAGYDHGSGWSALADRHGFVLVYPQQKALNNQNACFNWFVPGDIARDGGEAASIRQMVEHAVLAHGIDRTRVFVTGLSAGGAMAAVMLAAYPDVFAAGAVIAGLPYGVALNVQAALENMFQGRTRGGAELGGLVRAASRHAGPWPSLSVWHGAADSVVKPGNADELVKQWRDLHGLAETPDLRESVDGHGRAVWRNASGRDVVESYTIAGMGHGTPLATGEGEGRSGHAGAYMLEAGISSTDRIAAFWGLTETRIAPSKDVAIVSPDGSIRFPDLSDRSRSGGTARRAATDEPRSEPASRTFDVGTVIAKALRAAGLTKD